VKLLEGLARAKTPLGELADAVAPIHVAQRRVACPWGRRGAVMRKLMEDTEGERRELVDGVKVQRAGNEWALIIPHSHRPYFVVTVEAPDGNGAKMVLGEYCNKVEAWRDEQ
jgi:mannose-1-phosphate guanylyltransferase/phosphomannomutase